MSRRLVRATPSAEHDDPAERDGEGRPVREQVVASTAVRAVERVEGQVLTDAFHVEQREESEQERLDEEEPDECADQRSHLAVHDRADRDAHQQPDDHAEERLAGPFGDVRVDELEVAAVDRHPDRRDHDDDDDERQDGEEDCDARPRSPSPRARARVPASPAASA